MTGATESAEPLADVWCEACPEPATEIVGDKPLCRDHAALEMWKLKSPSWRTK